MEPFLSENTLPILASLAILLLLALVFIARQFFSAKRLLESKLELSQTSEQELREELHQTEKSVYSLEMQLSKERALAEQKFKQLEEHRKQLKIEFENLANRILDDKAKSFDKSNRSSMESLLKPFREQVEGFQKRVNDVHSESIKGNAMLEGEIKKVLEVGLKMGSDAQNLTDALKGSSQKRGSWGESLLERTLEISGLINEVHYEKQTSLRDAKGNRKQTDFLIKLPDNKHIIIDSKVSLAAYDSAVSAENDEQLNLALKEHANAVKRHIDELSAKDYTNLIGIRSPSFVLMFMPIEPAYIEALKYEKDLFDYGYRKNIVLVSHTTLIPILRTVANLWAMEHSNREARELGEKAGDIFNQVCTIAERLNKLGGSLAAASNHFNKTVDALQGRQGLHGKVERFSKLSTKVSKSMEQIEQLDGDLKHQELVLLAEPLVASEDVPANVSSDASKKPSGVSSAKVADDLSGNTPGELFGESPQSPTK